VIPDLNANNREAQVYRGSRKHILDWTEEPSFVPELLDLAEAATARVSARSQWMPRSYREPDEARLETFGPKWMSGMGVWEQLRKWWLKHERGANTPNWDIALGCELEGKAGLILVEAKAHKNELKTDGKVPEPGVSANSQENHAQIVAAIDEACVGLRHLEDSVTISCSSHYQLANRLAFTWKLATLGVPTVLVYLGFYGDTGIRDVGPPFESDVDWRKAFDSYSAVSGSKPLFEKRLECGAAPAWMFVRARHVLEVSPPKGASDLEAS
jgi:hypothetical protein